VIVENAGADCRFLLIGDHAGREIPGRLGDLGLTPDDLERHIAWDIGVAGLGARLAALLQACFIRQSYSRLVVDCNRRPDSEESIPTSSDGVAIPGNARLDSQQKCGRLEAIYRPYHGEIARVLDTRESRGGSTILVSLHSFTPRLRGLERPWRFGVLHRGDSPFSTRMLEIMTAALGEAIGDNQPYAMDESDNTVPLHLAGRAMDYLELEVRQDLIGEERGQASRADEIAGFLLEAAGEAE